MSYVLPHGFDRCFCADIVALVIAPAGLDPAGDERNQRDRRRLRRRVCSEIARRFGSRRPAVGGLLAHVLGRVPLPGSRVTTHGITLTAEGGPDPRGRIRINTVLAVPAARNTEQEPGDGPGQDPAQGPTSEDDPKGREHGHTG